MDEMSDFLDVSQLSTLHHDDDDDDHLSRNLALMYIIRPPSSHQPCISCSGSVHPGSHFFIEREQKPPPGRSGKS